MSSVAIVDISSASIGIALVKQSKGSKPEIIQRVRREVNFQENLTSERFLHQVVLTLEESITQLISQGASRPEKVVCFLSAPFYASRTQVIKKSEIKPFLLTSQLVNKLVMSQVATFKRSLPSLFSPQEKKSAHELIQTEQMQIKTNGYLLPHPFGQKVNELEIAHYLNLGSSRILDQFRKVIMAKWHHVEVEFCATAFAFYQVLKDISDQDSFVILDVDGEVSEISLVWQKLLRGSVSYPFGSHWLLRTLVKEFATTPAEMRSSLALFIANKQHPLIAERINQALNKAKTKWLDNFRQGLIKVLDDCFMPSTVFIVSDPLMAPLFHQWLQAYEFGEFKVSRKPFMVNVLSADILREGYSLTSGVIYDQALVAETVFYGRIKKSIN